MADLWTLPSSTPYRWSTNGGTRTTPSTGRKATGWEMGDIIDPLQWNDIAGVTSDWTVLLQAISPADGTLAAQSVDIYDTAGTPALAGSWVAGSVADSVALVVGAASWETRELGMVGPCAVIDARGIRWGYDPGDILSIDHDFGPETGGWSSFWDVATGGPSALTKSAAFTFLTATGVGTPYNCAQRIRVQVAAESAQSSGHVEIGTLAATFTGAAVDLTVSLIEITRSTGAESVIGSITSAAPIQTFAGGYVVDPDTKRYCLEIRSNALALTTTDGVRAIRLICAYQALNPTV